MIQIKQVVKPVIRYSQAFKRAIVSELEREAMTVGAIKRKYGVRGCGTIENWIRQYGNGSRGKVIRVERPEEIDEYKRLKERVRRLESALADANLDLALEKAYTQLACERAGIQDVAAFKKKRVGRRARRASPKRPLFWGQCEFALPQTGHESAKLLCPASAAAAAGGG